jgi:hypothetical protein
MAKEKMSNTSQAHEVMIREELGIDAEELKGSAMEAGIVFFLSFCNRSNHSRYSIMFTSGMKAYHQYMHEAEDYLLSVQLLLYLPEKIFGFGYEASDF